MSVVSLSKAGGFAVVIVNNPPVNALSQAVRQGLQQALEDCEADEAIRAVILACAGRTFIAGADIREFGMPPKAPALADVVARIENCPKPVIAAIHGTALGGGLEVALGCHFRVAHHKARVGLPEVNLGFLPGAGGTQRLPRLVGAVAALEMMVSGRHVPAQEALDLGIIDKLLSEGEDLIEAAKEFAAASTGPRRTCDLAVAHPADGALDAAFEKAARGRRGQHAPAAIADCVQAALNSDFDTGMARERAGFSALAADPQSAAMQHVFFAERAAKKQPGLSKETKARAVATVGIIGAGTMGGGIAVAMAEGGKEVRLLEAEASALDRGLALIKGNWQAQVKKGRLSENQFDTLMARIKPTLAYADLADADLIIEAVFEDMAVKKKVFRELDAVAKPGAILASNTSYLDIDEIAAVTKRPGDVLGLHFFSPANIMKLLEIVRGAATKPQALATAIALAGQIGKIPVVSGVCPGFIGNRMLRHYGRVANTAVVEGTPPHTVDQAMMDFGMPMGPMAMSDLAGLDIGYLARKGLSDEDRDITLTAWLDELVIAGRKGQKTGAGIYRYQAGSRTPIPAPETDDILKIHRGKFGIVPVKRSPEEISEQVVLALVNEGGAYIGRGDRPAIV